MVMNIGDALAAYRQTMNGAVAGGKLKADVAQDASFEDTLKGFVGDAIKSVKDGEQAMAAGASGKANLQEVVLAVNNAEVMMQTVMAVRDKVIAAYQDIIRTSV
ncbi:MAG: flagellar hook-basal body complex protein FliE [Alphaproteobacteria bacterium]|nr:flagellar hook-basal body complex protein FliE [Alphaproteobacteria bacterium]